MPTPTGYFAIGFDDNYVANSGTATTLAIVSTDATRSVVTQTTSCDNTGSGGIGQFYLFQVSRASGSPDFNVPIGLQWTNSAGHAYVSNLWILGPNEFTYTLGTPLSFDRTNPYAISSQFLSTIPNGCGCLRFMDSVLGWGNAGISNVCEPWEMRNLTDFSWNGLYSNNTIGLAQAQTAH